MAPKRNFLLGKGERLAEDIRVGTGPVTKVSPYSFVEAKQRLKPMISEVATKIEELPSEACPDEYAVAKITMNPEYIAKTYYPSDLLKSVGLETVGSKARVIKPEKRSGDREAVETVTTELYVIGKRANFRRWAQTVENLQEGETGAAQITAIEQVTFPSANEKLKIDESNAQKNIYEVVLHLDEENGENRYLSKFRRYLNARDINPDFSRRFYAGGLCFVELEAKEEDREFIAQFSLVRVVRTMPSLRLLRPAIRTGGVDLGLKVDLPDVSPLDPHIKVAIFDGGIPDQHPITRWATNYDVAGIGNAVQELQEHGVSVTSAYLFGHINTKVGLPQPYSFVDHYRVLDDVPGANPFELFEILDRIKDVLETNNYDFINLSLGPRLPIDDDEIHVWTAVLDDYLSKRPTLATIAVGNDGEGDPTVKANRVQVPSDCVNALAIGACDVPDADWQRAPYSSVGPGRSPGLVKPDLVEFGGSMERPFLTLDALNGNRVIPTGGTSFAAPATMRLAAGVKAHFGNALSPLAIRALLVHCSERSKLPKEQVGFGRIARSLDRLVVCEEGSMRVVFQGRITASKYIRTPIPIPAGTLPGRVIIKATLCYASAIDPHHPENYTRSGLEVSFRPNKTKRNVDKNTMRESVHAATKPFFGTLRKQFQTEVELRRDALKWENCMHAERVFNGTSLNDPVFDIHYNARLEGHNDSRVQEIEYALIISVEATKVIDLYDRVVRRYATQLEQLTPVIDIPVRIL
jgi:hypothetical protein